MSLYSSIDMPIPFTVFYNEDIFIRQSSGGIRCYFENLITAIAECGLSSNTVDLGPHDPSDYILHRPIAELTLGRNLLALINIARRCILSAHYRFNAKRVVYHPTYYRDPFLVWSRAPIVSTIHDMIHELYPHYFSLEYQSRISSYTRSKKNAIFASKQIIAVSNSTKSDILAAYPGINSDLISVIYHGSCHIRDFLRTADAARIATFSFSRDPFFLYVGSRLHYKGFSMLVDAFKGFICQTGAANARLICVGAPFTCAEQILLNQIGFNNKVQALQVSNSDLAVLYTGCVCLIYPSRYEGFGLPLIEAMAAGSRVICSDIPSSREIAGDYAMFFPPHEVKSLIQLLISTYTTQTPSKLRSSLIAYASRFTWKDCASRTLEVYLRSLSL